MRLAIALTGGLALLGCAVLPSSGPSTNAVIKVDSLVGGKPISVVQITGAESLPPSNVLDSNWPIGDAPSRGDVIWAGDRLKITIYEIGYGLFANSGLSGAELPSQSGAPAASGRTLPELIVPESGAIALPYLGKVQIVGRNPLDVGRELERRLRGKSQNAQVVVTNERGERHSVVVSGDVKQPGRLMLSSARERVLDSIALAGGPTSRIADTIVRLSRDGQTSELRLQSIAPASPANVILGAGDKIELVRNVRSFTVLGAAKSVSEIAFDSDQLTLSEALARAGGPVDDRADARGVFVFRYEGVSGSERPVIYKLDLLQPQSYFAAQRFQMREKDLMLIANARSNQLNKFVQMINQLVSPAVAVDILTR